MDALALMAGLLFHGGEAEGLATEAGFALWSPTVDRGTRDSVLLSRVDLPQA